MNQIINSRATQSIFTDTYANRPGASALKNGIFVDNTGVQGMFYSNGSTWTKIAGTGGGGGSQTFQQVLDTGNLLVSGSSQSVLGAGLGFLWDNFSTYTINTLDLFIGDTTSNYISKYAGNIHLGYPASIGEIFIDLSVSNHTSFTLKDFDVLISTFKPNFLQIDTDTRAYRIGDFAGLSTFNFIEILDGILAGMTINATGSLTINCDTSIELNGYGLILDTNMTTLVNHNNKAPYHLKITIPGGTASSYAIPIYQV
jgi:hypothetical protein